MPGILYVVATPIGNLEDVTLRALRVLREVTLIAAEDTRRTARLLQHYSIPTRTTSLHEHNERAKTPGLIERLRQGESIALVSDAGTPVLSDPGALLVAAAHDAGIRVEPIPGPSAVVAAISASGVRSEGFLFLGFPPSRSTARKKWLLPLIDEPRAVVIFEAPHRIRSLLADLQAILGDRDLTIGRELTKTHEQLVTRPISKHLAGLGPPKGEFTVVIHPPEQLSRAAADGDSRPSSDDMATEFGCLTNNNRLNRREALKSLAGKYGMSSRDVYRILEEAKK